MCETIIVENLTNREFLERHALPGRIGVVGGATLIDRMINRGQRHQIKDRKWSTWSHAFVFQGRRADGQHWVVESDIGIQRKHIRLGVQENRAAKYFDEEKYTALAVIDLGLAPAQEQLLISRALELVAAGTRYSLREIIGTLWALRRPTWRPRENRLAREQAFYCSAFVRHIFSHAGVDLALGIAVKNTTPEDIAQTIAARQRWLMVRPAPVAAKARAQRRLRAKQGYN
jgi:hypothetical protein